MSSTKVSRGRWWPAYLKAAVLILPSVIFFSVAAIFMLPKLKQMCADTNYDARYLFGPIDIVVENFWLLLPAMLLLFGFFEYSVSFWRQHRSGFMTLIVFLVHSAVLLGLVTSLAVMTIVGPAMSKHL
jgi:hypothetical protein